MQLLKLYINQEVADSDEVVSIKSRLNIPSETVQDARELFELISSADDPVKKGKEILFLTKNNGAFIRPCPGTRHYTCCGYKILHIGTFCAMDCSYCIQQSYFHPPVLQYFVNHDDLLSELDILFQKKG